MRTTRSFFWSLLAAFCLMAGLNATQVLAADAKVDINNATTAELEKLDGVGAATAKKIIAGRPYKTEDDLVKAGITKATVEKFIKEIEFGTATVVKKDDAKPAADTKELLDINTATLAELEKLDGVGAATAKKIIAGRPYKTEDDIIKAGISKATVTKFFKEIEFTEPNATAKKDETKTTKPAPTKEEEVEAKVPPQKGMVWVNTSSKVYHTEGDPWYGKTKKGEFMTEEDAIKFGAHKDKNDK